MLIQPSIRVGFEIKNKYCENQDFEYAYSNWKLLCHSPQLLPSHHSLQIQPEELYQTPAAELPLPDHTCKQTEWAGQKEFWALVSLKLFFF